MSTRPPRARSPRAAPAAKASAAAVPAPDPSGGAAPRTGAQLLKAGLEAVAAHNPLFETLLDMDAARRRHDKKPLFKLPTFEDLFDERVARTLARLGVLEAIDDLRKQVASLEAQLVQAKKQEARAAPPVAKPAARRKPR